MNVHGSAARELIRSCEDASRGGADFPTIWHRIIRRHPLVRGVPIQRLSGDGTYLEVRLMTGQSLIVAGDGRTFHLA
jgi:hypothetical protein